MSYPTDKRRPMVGVAAILCRHGKVLLGRRRGSHGAGAWQFPGGHLELNESVEACAVREVYEETGLTVRSAGLGLFTNDLFEAEGKHYITLFVLVEGHEGEPFVREPDKCDRWAWFDWRALPEPLFLPIKNLSKLGQALATEAEPGTTVPNHEVFGLMRYFHRSSEVRANPPSPVRPPSRRAELASAG